MSEAPYTLTRDVHLCLADECLVFLDLKADKYFCLNRADTSSIASFLLGSRDLPVGTHNTGKSHADEEAAAIASELSSKGLIATDDGGGRPIRKLGILEPAWDIGSDQKENTSAVECRYLFPFVSSCLKASWMLRFRSLYRTVKGVEEKKRCARRDNAEGVFDIHELTSTFHRLRRLYGRNYLCLYDSLALFGFLASYNHFPQWVFAVSAAPFGAHCWLQYNDRVLNDRLDHVRSYTPIMVV